MPNIELRIPTFPFVTYNSRGLAAYAKRRSSTSRSKRKQMGDNIKTLANNNDIILLQETHLNINEQNYLNRLLPSWRVYYNNLSSSSSGVAILLSPNISSKYTIAKDKCSSAAHLSGNLLHLHLTPKPNTQLYSLGITCMYLKTNDSDYALKTAQVRSMMEVQPADYNLMGGDLNFTEHEEDTSTATAHQHTAKKEEFLKLWHEYLRRFGLRELYQPAHTCITVSLMDERASSTSKLDRIYGSYTEADCALVQPLATLPYIPYNAHNAYRRAPPADCATSAPHFQLPQLVRVNGASDHLPVRGGFTVSKRSRPATVPAWVAHDPAFRSAFLAAWTDRRSQTGYAGLNGFGHLQEFKTAIDMADTEVRAARKARPRRYQNLASQYTMSLVLLRECSKVTPHKGKIRRLLHRHPYLRQYLNLDSYADTAQLRAYANSLISELATAEVESAAAQDLQEANIQQHHARPAMPAPSATAINKIKAILPSSRQKTSGLRRRVSDDLTTDPEEMAKITEEYWGKQEWAAYKRPEGAVKPEVYLRDYRNIIPPTLQPTLPSIDAIIEAINDTNNSSPGPDGISFAVYRVLAEEVAPILLEVLQELSQDECAVPDDYNIGNLFLILKTGTMLPADTRPITVNNADNRIVAMLLVRAIMPAMEEILTQIQKGFINHRNYDAHLHRLNKLFYEAAEGRVDNDYFLLFLDTRKAFDSIAHDYINAILKKMNFPSWYRNCVAHLLAQVTVTPFFGGPTQTWIPRLRGVKQGCPLSPILFAICYDPLLRRLDCIPGITPAAVADDLAMGSSDYHRFRPCITEINTFKGVSGLGHNIDKTKIICSSQERDDEARAWVATTAWTDMRVAGTYVYLGVLFGATVTTTDVFMEALKKAEKRAQMYRHAFKQLSYSKRVLLFNVFIMSMFVYLCRFFLFPTGKGQLEDRVLRLIRRHIISYGTAYKHFHLYASRHRVGKLPAVKDIWAMSIAMLAAQANLEQWDGATKTNGKAHGMFGKECSSMLIEEQIRIAGMDFVCSHLGGIYDHELQKHFCAADFHGPTAASTRRLMYNRFVYCEYHYDQQDPDILAMAKKRGLHWGPRAWQLVKFFHQHFRHLARGGVPVTYRNVQFDLLANALSTDRRYGVTVSPNPAVHPCYYCGMDMDSIRHLFYGACEVICQSRALYETQLAMDLEVGAADFLHSSFLAFAPVSAQHTRAIATFNATVWYERCHYFRTLDEPPPLDQAVNRLADAAVLAWLHLSNPTSRSKYGAAGRRTAQQLAAAQTYADTLLTQISTTSTIAFTDGSSLGNPGPTGAGAYVQWSEDAQKHPAHLSVALSPTSTNNVGELWALAMTFQLLLLAHAAGTPLGETHIFSDSQYALGQILKPYDSSKATPLARASRDQFLLLNSKVPTYLHWIPGHAKVQGNHYADDHAKDAAQLAQLGRGIPNMASRIASRLFLSSRAPD